MLADFFLNSGSQEEFKLWIIDPKHTSEFEKNRTVLFPSQVSLTLNRVPICIQELSQSLKLDLFYFFFPVFKGAYKSFFPTWAKAICETENGSQVY